MPQHDHSGLRVLWRCCAAQAHKLDALDFFKGFAVAADELPDIIFASIGRTVWRDIGATAVSLRLMMKARLLSTKNLKELTAGVPNALFLVCAETAVSLGLMMRAHTSPSIRIG